MGFELGIFEITESVFFGSLAVDRLFAAVGTFDRQFRFREPISPEVVSVILRSKGQIRLSDFAC